MSNNRPLAGSWRPTATRKTLALRASLLATVRRFFAARAALEVETPVVVNAPVTDPHIHSARVSFDETAASAAAAAGGIPREYYLHTSPEYAMKRLLAAGSGDIYQVCRVMRGLEHGRHHNAEFTLIEWYRLGFCLEQLMSEVEALMRELLGASASSMPTQRLTYREAFQREIQLDPFTASLSELVAAARAVGFNPGTVRVGPTAADARDIDRDEILELLMGAIVGPRLGHDALTFVHGYPASQAALARLDPDAPHTALRFELYCQGIELANGFHELAAVAEQRTRFERDNAERRRLRLPTAGFDARLLAALDAGLPDCAGVALGFDRAVMLATGAAHIDEVIAFPVDRA